MRRRRMDHRLMRSAEKALLRAGAWPVPRFDADNPRKNDVLWMVPPRCGFSGFMLMYVEDSWHSLHYLKPGNPEDDPYRGVSVSKFKAPSGWEWLMHPELVDEQNATGFWADDDNRQFKLVWRSWKRLPGFWVSWIVLTLSGWWAHKVRGESY